MFEAITARTLKNEITGKLERHYGRDVPEASKLHIFKACALVVRNILAARRRDDDDQIESLHGKHVHYLSLEFLMGRSLEKNAYNLGILEPLRKAVEELGFDLSDILELEPDAGLGNGGLGRLAACFLDSMATLGLQATGYTICYEFGIFKQKIVDGMQVELPDNWLDVDYVWLMEKMDEVEEVRFGGKLNTYWDESGHMRVEHSDYTPVLAVPRDMLISAFGSRNTNKLRLWDAKSPNNLDMELFSRGEYLKAMEQKAMAEVIAKVLYPEDNHYEGRSLRLKQQYFFVSATVQSIVRKHRKRYGTLRNFHLKHVIHINDTHPTLVIPELMRILLDEEGFSWDDAWRIVTKSISYTNHTVMSEALERWPQPLVETLLPRIWDILREINNRYLTELREKFNGLDGHIRDMAIIWDGEVRMANLCVMACFAVNGVSELHSGILTSSLFEKQAALYPGKFKNVTNGIDHRRWLSQSNPRLHALITELVGDGYLKYPYMLGNLSDFADDPAVLLRIGEIKRQNKIDFCNYMKDAGGVMLDPDSIFDVQVKRLHEYKRQLLNLLHIMYLHNQIRDNPGIDMPPQTFLFGAKAAPGYQIAKLIIRLAGSVARRIDADPSVRGRIRVVFLENYRVSLAERLMPASEISEQISLSGTEASGTGNMKFMINGALTIGTLDGANVEMHELLGDDNMFIFGLRTHEVEELHRSGAYNPSNIYSRNPDIKRVIDKLSAGFDDGVSYAPLVSRLLFGGSGHPDEYMLLADFEAYAEAHRETLRRYREPERWNRMSLMNISKAGFFAADRSIDDYAKKIWNCPTNFLG